MQPVTHSALANTDYLPTGKHFGLEPGDTPFGGESAILQHIEVGATRADAINPWGEKYELERFDSREIYPESEIFLTAADIFKASRATALTRRNLG